MVNLKYRTLSGSEKIYDRVAAENFLATFKVLYKNYSPADTFNCDETGLIQRGQRAKSFVFDEASKGKKEIERITVLFGCSKNGKKLPTLYIGKSRNPRCFKASDMNKLEINYAVNKTACMTETIFNTWLLKINDYMKTANRKILLLINNCTAQNEPPVLSNILVVYFPPNTSALIQPLDMGTIKSIKDRYKEILSDFLLETINNND